MPPGQAISAVPRGVTALAALWVTVGRCLSESSWKTCDNGKVLLDADLPKDAAHRDCPTPLWPQSQRVYSVETPYNPEPAKVKCMDECISYNQTIPNSGAFRPVSAESGEYLYCPPQRWVNNLHNGATVLLYHPCSSLHERRLLSALAQSCINIFILTPHKNLDANRPIALVSWGRALEISTVVSSEICDWLERTLLTKPKAVERIYENQYNFLLIKAKNQKRLQENKGFLKQCCERAISHLPEKMKTQLHSSFRKVTQNEGRVKRAAVKSTTNLPKVTKHQSNSGIIHQLQSHALPKKMYSQNGNQSSTKGALSQSPSLKKRFIPNPPRTTKTKTDKHSQIQKNNSDAQPRDNEVIDLKEREVVDNTEKSNQTGLNDFISSTKSQAADGGDCQCKPNQVCECIKGAADQSHRAEVVFQSTPRTDEAVWAAGALGFILVLLTLSILHTRLYRHWRRGNSLYWHDPQQDYDSVADVIRRRLRLAKGRRKRGRKKCVVLLPSSSSSEEYP
ncbi:unnamed protein product [Knipowitschia caucasica]